MAHSIPSIFKIRELQGHRHILSHFLSDVMDGSFNVHAGVMSHVDDGDGVQDESLQNETSLHTVETLDEWEFLMIGWC